MRGGAPGRKAGFRLRQVGARDLAGAEAIARWTQRGLQHLHVVALKLEQGGIAQQIHIGSGGIEQNRLLGGAQRLALGENLTLSQPRPARSLESVEERLAGSQSVACYRYRARRPHIASSTALTRERIQILLPGLGIRADLRSIAG